MFSFLFEHMHKTICHCVTYFLLKLHFRNGFKVTSSLIKAREEHHLQNSTHNLVLDAWLKDKTEGKIVKMPKLAMLLEKVAKSGAAGTFIQLSTGCGLSLCYCPPL